MAVALTQSALPQLGRVSVPTYDRSALRTGVVHFGIGGFHRAHLAMYLDRLLEGGVTGAQEWAVTGVGLLDQDRRVVETLTAQDGLYTLVVKHPDGQLEGRVVGSIREALLAPDDPEAVLDRLTAPTTRVVSLTITEGGYLINQVTGRFDPTHPSLASDLAGDGPPRTAFGYLVEALRRRRDAGTAPFTVMSCDNLPGNGDVARHAVTTFAAQRDPELAGWIEEEVAFPNAMVDRITPVTTDEDRATVREQLGVDDGWPVVCEPFTQWVLEDHFVDGRPPVEEVGAQLVDDVEPYELMKLRLLNASHQALCYLGYLAGHRYAHEVCSDEDFVTFLQGYMRDEGRPTLPEVPGVDLQEYSDTLVERFANPQIRDTLARLCAESSDRIPKWLLPVVRHNLEHGGEISRSALVVAAWARYAEGMDEQGQPIEVVDHRRDRVLAAAQAQLGDDPLAFLRDDELFGDLAQDERFTSVYLEHLEVLHRDGAREAVRRVNTQQ